MSKAIGWYALACAAGLWESQSTHAAETAESVVAESFSADSRRRAASWGVSEQDWARYEELMRGRRGAWTPGADPLLVLGAHARTESERRRFAEAFVLAEHERVEGELAFERAVQIAWHRLFPGQPRIAGPAAAQAPERYAVVVDRDCADCAGALRGYLKSETPVDLYVRGAEDDDDLRDWAAAHGVRPGQVLGGLVTVNHGDASAPGDAPAVWIRRGGRWSAVE